MTEVFGSYSKYYNLLYKDKDYVSEVEFIDRLIRKNSSETCSVLDIGCGTGRHALLLGERGYDVTGVDLSVDMLSVADTSRKSSVAADRIRFVNGDIRTFELSRQYDAILALFHVMSYQVTNSDLSSAFASVRKHLRPGGIFIFDCWYGPAVLTERPSVRVKRLEDSEVKVTRIAEPVMFPSENVVDVNYDVFIANKLTGASDQVSETHRMRYLFIPEILELLSSHGLSMLENGDWMTGEVPGFNSWGVYFVVRG